MQAKHLIASTALSLLICSPNIFAQTPAPAPASSPAPTEQQKQAQKEVEKKALALLEDTIGDAQSLRVPENRTLVMATAADLLWTRDEKRARSLFTDALNTLAVARAASSAANAEDGDGGGRNYANYAGYMAFALRQQLLQMVARHDATLALDLLRAGSSVKQPPASNASTNAAAPAQANQNRGMMNEDARLEQSLIAQIAATDPKMALRVAEESLAKGVSPNLLSTLRVLQGKDAEAATKLAGSIVERLRTTNFQTNPESAFVLMQLFDLSAHPERYAARQQTAGDAAAATAEPAKKSQSPLLNETAMRDLADIAASAVLNGNAMSGITYQAPTLLPLIEKYAPTRAAQVRSKISDAMKQTNPEFRSIMKYQEQMQNGTPDSILQAAAKAPPEERDMLYQSAAWKALSQNDTTRARQIIQDNVTNSQQRTQLLAQIDRQSLTQALRLGKLDEARQMLRERGTRSKKDQATMLAMLAQVAARKGDRKFALEVLDEARQLVPDSQAQNQDQIDAQLAIATAYTFVEPTRSFEIIEPMIDQANELIRAAALLDKFGNSGQRFFRSGELLLSMAGASSLQIRSRYGRALTLLANADFDRARTAASRFQQPELRVMARLLIAQGALDTEQQSNVPQSDFDFMPGGIYTLGMGAVRVGNQ